jgi:hypothetical protein
VALLARLERRLTATVLTTAVAANAIKTIRLERLPLALGSVTVGVGKVAGGDDAVASEVAERAADGAGAVAGGGTAVAGRLCKLRRVDAERSGARLVTARARPSAPRVRGPTMPSTASPRAACTRRTAAAVSGPNRPSTPGVPRS